MENYILKKLVKNGMTVHSLRYKDFFIHSFPIPPLSEHQETVRRADRLTDKCDELEKRLRETTEKGKRIWESLSAQI